MISGYGIMYNMTFAYIDIQSICYFTVVFGSVPKYPFRKAALRQQPSPNTYGKRYSPPGTNAVAYMTLVIGRKPSSAISDSNVNSMAGSQAVMIASAYTLRSTARSFSVACSA